MPAREQPTEVVEPGHRFAAPNRPSDRARGVVVAPPTKKRRRWPWVLGGILVVLAILLTIAFFVG